jgi:hypothetical protein
MALELNKVKSKVKGKVIKKTRASADDEQAWPEEERL